MRLSWLEQKYGNKLSQYLKREHQTFKAKDAVLHFANYDPSQNKKYTQWMIKTYINQGYRFEDLNRVKETISFFMKYHHHLSIENKDINKSNSLAELWLSVKPFVENSDEYKSRAQTRDGEREKAYTESIILHQDDEVNIIIPLTKHAAKFHGRGTQWCTAAENYNVFHQYNAESPLIIFDIKGKGKFQLFATLSDFQFMNENDMSLDNKNKLLSEYWHIWGELVIEIATTVNSQAFHYIPAEKLTSEICVKSIQNDTHTNSHKNIFLAVPEKLVTPDVTEALLDNARFSQVAELLRMLPKEAIPYKTYKLLCFNPHNTIENIKKKYITKDFLKKAVECIPLNDLAIFADLIDDDILKIAMQSMGANIYSSYFSDRLNYDLYTCAIKQNGNNIKYVPMEMIDEDMALSAVQNNGLALRHLPEALVTDTICEIAIKKSPLAFSHVPGKYKTEKLLRMALEKDGRVISSAPHYLINAELAKLAVETTPFSFQFLSEKWKTDEIILMALKTDPKNLSNAPKHLVTTELCHELLKQDHKNILHFPPEHKTVEMYYYLMSLMKEETPENNQVTSYAILHSAYPKGIDIDFFKKHALTDIEKSLEWDKNKMNNVIKKVFNKEIDTQKVQDNFLNLST